MWSARSLQTTTVAIAIAMTLEACGADTNETQAPDAAADAAIEAACERDPTQLARYGYRPTTRVVGACTADDVATFGIACGGDPNSGGCAQFLAKRPPCARCILGDDLAGPLRRSAFGLTEISAGACAQVIAGESYDGGADAAIEAGGCGAAFEDLDACLRWTCGRCASANEAACRASTYRSECFARDPDAERCDALGAFVCVLGGAEDRARAIANAVCGP